MLYRSLMTFTVWAPTLDELCVCLCAFATWICVYLSIGVFGYGWRGGTPAHMWGI